MSENDKTQRSAIDLADARRKRLQPRFPNTSKPFKGAPHIAGRSAGYLTSELRPDSVSVRFGYMTKG